MVNILTGFRKLEILMQVLYKIIKHEINEWIGLKIYKHWIFLFCLSFHVFFSSILKQKTT